MKIERLAVGPLKANCYILYDEAEKSGVIIDPGDEGDRIVRAVRETGITVTHIVLTHGHFDHILALNDVQAAYPDAKLCICYKEERFLNDTQLNLSWYSDKRLQPVKADILLKEGDVIPVGKQSFTVIQTPGHSIGSICLHWGKILISGDTLFHLGIGRCDHPTGDLKSEVHSILEKLFVLEEDTVIYPGHGRSTTIGFEKENNEVYLYLNRTE